MRVRTVQHRDPQRPGRRTSSTYWPGPVSRRWSSKRRSDLPIQVTWSLTTLIILARRAREDPGVMGVMVRS